METIADKRCRHPFARGKVDGRVIRDLTNWRPLEEAQLPLAGSQQEVTEPRSLRNQASDLRTERDRGASNRRHSRSPLLPSN